MHHSDHIWQLMARALNQETSPAEQEELAGLLRTDELLQQQFELLHRIWQEREAGNSDESEARARVQKIIHRSEEEKSGALDVVRLYDQDIARRPRRRWIAAAGITLIAALSIGWLVWKEPAPGSLADSARKEPLLAQKGSRTRAMLPDGTTVWLNAGSKLDYINDFSGNTREVQLEGEAFFDVAKKAGKPFIVHTSNISIRVLGTVFNVKSYPEDKNVETTLYTGHVQVYRAGPDREPAVQPEVIDLRPNQKLILPKEVETTPRKMTTDIKPAGNSMPPAFLIATIDSTRKEEERFETAWLYSRLEFRGDDFETLAYKLERWYNVNIRFVDDGVKRLNFNGSFEKESIAEAFAALQTALPYFTFKIENNDITIDAP